MFDTDNEIISFALNLWGNYIETHSVSMSSEDVKKKDYLPKNHYESNYLHLNQKKLVKRIRYLSNEYSKEIS